MFEKINTLTITPQLIQEVKYFCGNAPTIAVDFDNTLALTDNFPNILGVNGECFNILKSWKNLGCKIILHTSRHDKDLDNAVVWCLNCGLFFDGINECVMPDGTKINNGSKTYATFYIDDRSVGIPLKRYKYNNVRDCVDWTEIDKIYTPVIKEIIKKVNE